MSQHTRVGKLILAVSVLLMAIILTMMLWDSYESKLNDERNEGFRLVSSAQIVASQTRDALSSIHVTLVTASTWVGQHPNVDARRSEDFAALMQNIKTVVKGKFSLRFMDRGGNLYDLPSPDLAALANVADRDYFQVQTDVARKALYMGSPVQSRVTGEWTLPVSYPLPDNKAGLVAISAIVDLQTLSMQYNPSVPREGGMVAIVRTDGTIMITNPYLPGVPGMNTRDFGLAYKVDARPGTRVRRGPAPIPVEHGRMTASVGDTTYPLSYVVSSSVSTMEGNWLRSLLVRLVALTLVGFFVVVLDLRILQLLRMEADSRLLLEQLARRDTLTGLNNRRHVLERLDNEMARALRYGRPLALALFDLDHFKAINDSFGHAEGDRVLVEWARLMESKTRATDVVGRIGGEEFMLVMPETSPDQAADLAERLRLACHAIHTGHGSLGVSTGLTFLAPDDTATTLLARADEALYDAKRGGRDQVRLRQA